VLFIILLLIRAIFNTRSLNMSIGTTFLVVWILALVMFITYAVKASANFKDGGSISQTINLKATPGNVYYLKFNDVKYLSHDDSLRLNVKGQFNNMTIENDDDENTEPQNVTLHVERSDIKQPELVETFRARGRDDEDALLNARNTKYIFIQQDSVLKFDDMLRRTADDAWHGEELELTLKLPLNAKAIIDQQLQDRLRLDGVNVYDCKESNKQDNATSAVFIMTDDGLQCKIDTVVIKKTPAQIDSARNANNAKAIAKLQAQVDSARRVDSLQKHK